MGTAFSAILGSKAIGLDRSALDLSRPQLIPGVLDEIQPSAVINCAAYTGVDSAEIETSVATVVNGESVGIMAEWCDRTRVPFMTFSTDYVFDGQATTPYLESTPTNPVNAYGRTKLLGEQLAVAHGGLVIRTSWIISDTHPSFVTTVLRVVARDDEIKVVDDQEGCPTIAADLASASLSAFETNERGLLHLVNAGPTTWHGLAEAAIRAAEMPAERLRGCSTEEYPTPARRPAYSVLGSERLGEFGLSPLPHWTEALPGLVKTLTTSGLI